MQVPLAKVPVRCDKDLISSSKLSGMCLKNGRRVSLACALSLVLR